MAMPEDHRNPRHWLTPHPIDAPPGVRQRAFNVPPATLALSGLMVAVHVGLAMGPPAWTHGLLHLLVVVPADIALTLEHPSLVGVLHQALTLVGHALVHVDLLHLVVNVGFLLAFGGVCERVLGTRRFLILFVACVIAGAVVQVAVDWGELVVMYGASGGVSGCFAAVIRLMIGDPVNPRRRRLGYNLLVALIVINVLFGVLDGAFLGGDTEIAWQAHLGGFLMGFLMVRPRRIHAPGA